MTQRETLELLVITLQQTNTSQSESIRQLTLQNEQLQNKLNELLAQIAWLNVKNGVDCYSKNGDAVTVLMWQS